MALTPRAVAGSLALFVLLTTLPLLGARRKDPQSSQNGFFSNCSNGNTCPTLAAGGTALLSGKDASGNDVRVAINLYDWSCVGCAPGNTHSVLDVVLTGTTSTTIQSVAVKGILPNPSYVTCWAFGKVSVGIGCVVSPAPDEDGDVQQPTPISGADRTNTRWDFDSFDQIVCKPSLGDLNPGDHICGANRSNLGEVILAVDNSLATNSLTSDPNNYLVTLTDGTPVGNLTLVPPSPTEHAPNNTEATATPIPTPSYQDYNDTSNATPGMNADGTEYCPPGCVPLPLDKPPFCNPINGVTGILDDRTFRTVWYSYTPSSGGSISVSTAGSRYDTLIYAFTGDPGHPSQAFCDDDLQNSGVLQAVITFPADADTPYQIVVGETPPFQTDAPGGLTGYPLSVDGALYFDFEFTPNPPTYPVPFIDSVQPAAAVPAETVPQISILGTGFVKRAVVKFNGANLTPASITPNKVILNDVVVPTNPATVLIAVVNPNQSPSVSTSNVMFFPVTAPAAPEGFSNVATALDGAVFAPVVTDLNNDGKLDVVFASNPNSGAVVLIGNGNGTFQAAKVYSALEDNNSVALGDFNGDGVLDLVVTDSVNSAISLLLGNGDGTFQDNISYAIGGSATFAMTGDFNGDGRLDLALLEDNSPETLGVMLGNGDGTFRPQLTFPAGAGLRYEIAGDFNGDGNLDIAVLNNAGSGGTDSVYLLLGNGDGTFQLPKVAQTGVFPVYEMAGDFNADGKLDMAVANQGDGTVSVLLGTGDGLFTRLDYPAGESAGSVAVGDINGDGRVDLLVGMANGLSLLLGNGDGTFQSASPFEMPNQPHPAVLGDFNGDGRLDVIAADDLGFDVSLQEVPAVSLSPSSLTFAPQVVATTSPAQELTLTNVGSAPLTVSKIVASGNFRQSDDCSGPLNVGASCTINVIFTPTNVNKITGAITLTDNASISPHLVGLSGSGVAPLSLSPATLFFGTVTVGNTSPAKSVKVTNNAPTTLNIIFAASGNYSAFGSGGSPCGTSLTTGESCTMSVTFTPTANGQINGAVTVTDHTVVNQQEVALSGTGTGGPVSPLLFSPPTLSFPNQAFNTASSAQTETVSNGSVSSVRISTITSSGNFTQTGSGATPCQAGTVLAASKSCTMTVVFTPTYLGTIDGVVVVSDNSSVGQQVLNVGGVGVLPATVSPTSLAFPAQSVGTTSPPRTVTLTNRLSTTLSSIAIGTSGDFSLSNSTCSTTLAAKGQCTFTVGFTPGQVGNVTGSVTVHDSALNSPQVVNLSGIGR